MGLRARLNTSMRPPTFKAFLTEARTLSKVPCRRCGGSGKFAYNLLHGDMCYGCHGSGYQYVDLEAERRRAITAAETRRRRQQYHDEVLAVTMAYAHELQAQWGTTYDLDTTLGLEQLNQQAARRQGMSFWMMRDARLKTLGIVKPK